MHLLVRNKEKAKRKPKSVWVRNWILRRNTSGAYHSLLRELEAEDPRSLRNFLRMDKTNFEFLLDKVSPFIQKKSTPMRDSLSAGEKLALTLRYLASGDSYKSLEFLYRVPRNSICQFIPEVCQVIYEVLKNDYVQVRNSARELMRVLFKYTLCVLSTGEPFDGVKDHIWTLMEQLAAEAQFGQPVTCPYAFGSQSSPRNTSILSTYPSDSETARLVTSLYICLDDILQEEIARGRNMAPVEMVLDRLREELWSRTWDMVTANPRLAWILDT